MARKRHHSSKKKHSGGHIMEHSMGSKSGHQGAQYHHNSPYPGGSEEAHELGELNAMRRKTMEKPGHMYGNSNISMLEARKKEEAREGGMIHADYRAIANMPQNVMIKAYPDRMNYLPEELDDTIHGVDRQMNYDDSKREDNFYPKKI